MKKIIWIVVFFIIALSLFFIFRKPNKIDNIYKLKNELVFAVRISNVQHIDTIYLNIKHNSKIMGFDEASWLLSGDYSFKSNNETSLITKFYINYDDNSTYIKLSSPTMQYFALTYGVPSPQIKLPVHKGYTMNTKITYKTDVNDNPFVGQTVKGQLKVVDKIYYNNPAVQDWCWVIESYGNSQFGKFKAKYYFNEEKGFVYLFYDFVSYKIEMSLISSK